MQHAGRVEMSGCPHMPAKIKTRIVIKYGQSKYRFVTVLIQTLH